MTRASILLSTLCLALLLILGLTTPFNPVMWLAGTSLAYTWIRICLIVVLLTFAFTSPPRHIQFRVAAGAMAWLVFVATVALTYSGDMKILDTLSLSAAAVTIGAAALEFDHASDQVDIESLRQAKRYSTHHAS